MTASTARSLRVTAMGLQRVSTALTGTVEGLCDHDLAEHDREERTEQLYAALADIRAALTKLAEGADADTVDAEVVLTVAKARWRRHGWGRTLQGW